MFLGLVCGRIKAETPPTMRPAEDAHGFYFSMFSHVSIIHFRMKDCQTSWQLRSLLKGEVEVGQESAGGRSRRKDLQETGNVTNFLL